MAASPEVGIFFLSHLSLNFFALPFPQPRETLKGIGDDLQFLPGELRNQICLRLAG
jgi:hypothetical protein